MGTLRLALAAMGTRFELVLPGDAPGARAVGELALEEIGEWHRRLSRFEPDSLVSHIIRTAVDTPVRLDRDTFALFADAQRVWRDSGGAFDITVASPNGRSDGSGLGGASVRGRADAIALDDGAWTLRLTRPGISIDLGAIAKGHALDRAAAVLRAHGVASALLHGGTSSVVAIGRPADEEGWNVRIGTGRAGPAVALVDESLAVSHAESRDDAGRPVHIIDPRTAAPVARDRHAAVVGPSARLADAWATALTVLDQVPETFPSEYRVVLHGGSTP